MEAVLTNILNVVPGWLALALMLGGFAFTSSVPSGWATAHPSVRWCST